MTDKQIIDGVNVAKCRNFISEWDFNNCGHICKGTECKYKRLWYKKQLARKEQELKNICKAFDIEYLIDKETGDLIGRYNKLYKKEQECEELKHKVELMMDCASCKVDEYKQTLTEIKEIAESYTTCKMDWYFGFKNILQKISEVME